MDWSVRHWFHSSQAGDSVVMRGSDTDGRKSYIEIPNDENAPISSCSLIVWDLARARTQLSYLQKRFSLLQKVFKLIDYDNVATQL